MNSNCTPIAITSTSQPTFLQRLGVIVGPFLLNGLLQSLNIISTLRESYSSPTIVVFWHGGMLVPWFMHRGTKAAALVSNSRDGDVLAATLHRWGIKVVRGSSSAGGSEAISEMVELIADGYTLLITPDGPRGPHHEMKIGALVVAQRTGASLMLCAPHYRNAFSLHSWDSFQVPKPFSTVDLAWRGPIAVARDCIGAPLEDLRAKLETELVEMTADA